MGGERADAHARARPLDAGELLDAADVDQVGRLRQAQLHHRQQAVAAGEQLGVLLRAEQVERLRDARGAVIVESCRIHLRPSLATARRGAVTAAALIARQTFSGRERHVDVA